MLNYASIRYITVSIVHHGITLIVDAVNRFLLEINGPILQHAEFIVIKLIYLACEDYLVCQTIPARPIFEIINICQHLNTFKKTSYQFIVATNRNTLIFVIEIIIIENKP